MSEKIFEYVHQNKTITTDAVSIDDFILSLENHLQFFKELRSSGVELDTQNSDMSKDYAVFITTDQDIANKFGFDSQEYDEDYLDYDDDNVFWEEENFE